MYGVLPLNHTFQAILQKERKLKYFIVTNVYSCNKEGSHWMVFEKMANWFFIFYSLGIYGGIDLFLKKFTYIQNHLQNLFSSTCGFFLHFVLIFEKLPF